MILKEAWPRLLSWDELQTAAVARVMISQSESVTADELQALTEIMFAAFGSGVIHLHSHRPTLQLQVSSHPVANRLARWQAQRCRAAAVGASLLTIRVCWPMLL